MKMLAKKKKICIFWIKKRNFAATGKKIERNFYFLYIKSIELNGIIILVRLAGYYNLGKKNCLIEFLILPNIFKNKRNLLKIQLVYIILCGVDLTMNSFFYSR